MSLSEFSKETQRIVEKVALLNAVQHGGEGRPGPVIAGLLGDKPSLKKEMSRLGPAISKKVQEINSLSLEEQRERLLSIDPSALDKKEPNTDLFKDIEIDEDTDVVTAFPPGPEKYPHIGHAKAILVNYKLAQRHNGKFVFRFEDTNPLTVKEEYYQAMLEDFAWLGVEWDECIYASDYMDIYYEKARQLLQNGDAYIADETAEEISQSRRKKQPLESRNNTVKENLELWKEMMQGREDVVMLLKGDITHKNSAMRDPSLFRVLNEPHPRTGKEFNVWPTYDMQTTTLDGEFGTTHRIRSKEFELRNELHRYMQQRMGYTPTKIYEFARFNVKGALTSGRKIREGIKSGELSGWDDPQLLTLKALRRRGYHPKAIEEFVLTNGLSSNEATLHREELERLNYEHLKDSSSVFFMQSPLQLDTKKPVLVSEQDSSSLQEGKTYKTIDKYVFVYGDGTKTEPPIGIQAALEENVDTCTVVMPGKQDVSGWIYYEESLEEGEVVELSALGYAKVEDVSSHTFCFTQ